MRACVRACVCMFVQDNGQVGLNTVYSETSCFNQELHPVSKDVHVILGLGLCVGLCLGLGLGLCLGLGLGLSGLREQISFYTCFFASPTEKALNLLS